MTYSKLQKPWYHIQSLFQDKMKLKIRKIFGIWLKKKILVNSAYVALLLCTIAVICAKSENETKLTLLYCNIFSLRLYLVQ